MREVLNRYGRHNLGFLWLFVEPMIFTLGVAFIFTIIKGEHNEISGLSIAAIVLTGYSTLLLWRNMPNRCVEAISANCSLLFHRQVRCFDILFSRCLMEAAGASMSFIFLTIILGFAMVTPFPYDMLKVLVGWFLLMWYAFGISILIGALSEKFEIIEKIWHPIQYLTIPFSGALFSISMVPEDFQRFLVWFPIINCVELLREGFFGSDYQWHYNIEFIFFFNSILTLFALAILRSVARNITVTN